MELETELACIADAAKAFADAGEELVGIVPSEPRAGTRVYVCSYECGDRRAWLALDSDGCAVRDRGLVRDAVSVAAMCELAEESAGGGKLDELRSQLVALRITENLSGIEEAEEAARELERTVGSAPRVASLEYLDEVGAATRRLEEALGDPGPSPFAEAMKQQVGAIDELAREVEQNYKGPLE